MKLHLLPAFGFVFFVPLAAGAQTVETSGYPQPPQSSDLSIQADVHIDSMRYEVVPKMSTLKIGGVNQIGGYTITRYNLPAHPVAGVTYHNVRIVMTLDLRFTDPKTQALFNSLKSADLLRKP
ncbi:MAG: hypothetical protein ABR584_12645 [Candidatus Baltobacteraceae bacterium]